ncbi:MAG: universal stress protein [Methyloceanibacter sp.]|nr:universal stress protein [Methyloceanibacter sp.]
MSFKDVIVYVDGTDASKARDRLAIGLAKAQGAHLVAVAFAPQALMPLYGADVAFADMSGVLDGVKAQGEEALARFQAAADETGVSYEVRLMHGTSDEFPHDFAAAARLTDLAILGQPRDGDPLVGQYALVERCLFASGRPVLIVPADPDETVSPETVVVAWDGSAEAARAFGDALSFLKAAKRVVLLSGLDEDAREDRDLAVEGMVAHLGRHGVNVEPVAVSMREGADVGRLLISRAKDLNADMIVMGAFHHSRWREFILGGVTLTMLEEAPIPLFMSH